MKRRRRHWGNSVLAFNLKHWECGYCGHDIKDRKPFEITMVNGNPLPFIFCSPFCERLMVKKLELKHRDI